MKNIVSKVVLTALVGCLSGVAQQNIPCPSYQTDVTRLDLSDGQNRSVWQVRLCLDDHESPIELSAARIRRNVAPEARTEVEFGIDAALKGKNEEAWPHFVQAVQIDPYYWDAVSQLASAMVRLHQPSQAVEFLVRAIMIDPRQTSSFVNSAWAMLLLGHPEEAERYARRAVMIRPSSAAANYVLGWSLILQKRRSSEVISALTIAERRLADATTLIEWSERQPRELTK